MATTVWKGHLTFGLISIPMRMSAAARGERISFNQLHNVCHSRLKQPLFCPVCNRNVERSEIVKGHEYEKDQYVLFSEEELDKIEPSSARVMEKTGMTFEGIMRQHMFVKGSYHDFKLYAILRQDYRPVVD